MVEAEAVFREFTVLRRVLSDSSMDASKASNASQQSTNSDYVEPLVPRSRLSQALARLRLHFSESELSTEVAVSASKSGLNHDEFMYLVGTNINRRMSIEKVVKAFLALQPSGSMGVEELRTFMLSSSLHREGQRLQSGGEADAEPLTEDEFSMFCGLADPRGTRVVHILTLLECFYPKAPRGLLETLLAKHGIGASVELRDEKIRQEASSRRPIEELEASERTELYLQHASLIAQYEDAKAAKIRSEQLEREAQLRDHQQREAAAREAAATHQQRITESQRLEVSSRRTIEEAERVDRAALMQAEAKSKKANTPQPPKPKAAVGCCRIVPDKQ